MKYLTMLSFFAGIIVGNCWFPEQIPLYCSKDMPVRDIPPLSEFESSFVGNLKQVQVLIRHGARTPYSKFLCWKDYNLEWKHCNVTDLMMTSLSPHGILHSPWLFRKVYDGSENLLGGDCLTGQLIPEGYEQETYNGLILSNGYLSGPRKLFPSNLWDDIDKDLVYFRADDDTSGRVMMSGQLVVQSMFRSNDTKSIVDFHTGDYSLDQIYPNVKVCPRLDAVAKTFYSSPEWVEFNNSNAVHTMTNALSHILGEGMWTWFNLMDCFLTTLCTGREIPTGGTGAEDDPAMTDRLFKASIQHAADSYSRLLRFNNSEWSKLAMGNTAWHIRSRIEGAVAKDPKALRFALYAGHDTTIMPFLAALLGSNWNEEWPPYASMVSIELYENAHEGGQDLFRLLYNGKVQMLPGCGGSSNGTAVTSESAAWTEHGGKQRGAVNPKGDALGSLCEVNVLLEALSFGLEKMPCSLSAATSPSPIDGQQAPAGAPVSRAPLLVFSYRDWVFTCLLSNMCGVLIGSAVVVFWYKRFSLASPERTGFVGLSTEEFSDQSERGANESWSKRKATDSNTMSASRVRSGFEGIELISSSRKDDS